MIRPGFAAALVLSTTVLCATLAQAQTSEPPPDLTAPPADAVKSPTGLISKLLVPGPATEKPMATDMVTVDYTGWASDGRMVDSSVARGNPSTFPLDKVMAGWRECVQLMAIGEKRRCWVPQNLAYNGAAGRPTGTVVFDIELRDFRGSPTVPPPDVKQPPADAHRTPSGLAYKILRPGKGVRRPDEFSRVVVHYTGWTTDGKVFDSSVARGTSMTLGLDEVIPGWKEGMQLMVEGERTRFWIPENIAYKGESGSPRGMLVFDVELIRIQ
jgi:peptidylprolyl isomerase